MADGCHHCGGICCLQLRVACFSRERRYHHQSTRRHSPEDLKIRIKRFYLFESQMKMTLSGTVQQPETGRGHDEITNYRRPPRISFHAQQVCFDNNNSRSTGTSPTSCFRLQNPVIHNYKETPVATLQVKEEARCNQPDKLLIKKAVTINKPLQRIVLQKFIHLRKYPAIYSPS